MRISDWSSDVCSSDLNLARLLRQATRVRRELKAATAETRFSGLVLGAMPLLLTAVLTTINPGYTHFFLDTPEGRRLAVIALGLQLTGMALMHRLMRSAEHTSELQSLMRLSYAVFCFQKKKQK